MNSIEQLLLGCLILVFFGPGSCIVWRAVTFPASWFKHNVVANPMTIGTRIRNHIHGRTVNVINVSQPMTQEYIDAAIDESVVKAESAQRGQLYNSVSDLLLPQVDTNPIDEADTGSAINLDNILAPGKAIPEFAATKLESFLKPLLDESKKSRDEEEESDELEVGSIDQALVQRFGALPEGEHVYDGNNIIMKIPTLGHQDGRKTEVAYIDLSELRSILANRNVLTIFTGLGNQSDAAVGASGEPVRSAETFQEKMDQAANRVRGPSPPRRMANHLHRFESLPQVAPVVNRFGRVPQLPVTVPDAKTTEDTDAAIVFNTASVPIVKPSNDVDATNSTTPGIIDNDDALRIIPLRPVDSEATPAPPTQSTTTLRYSQVLPRPVFKLPSLNSSTTTEDTRYHIFREQVRGVQSIYVAPPAGIITKRSDPESDKELELAVEQHAEGGLEGYLAHLRIHHDKTNCVSLMVCEIAAIPERYGEHGVEVANFFRTRTFPEQDTASRWFKTVANLGSSIKSIPICRSSFRPCFLTTQQLIELGRGLQFYIILN